MKPIGEILIEQGSIAKEQLDRALEQQKLERSKRRIGEILIELGVITESDIVVALSTQFNFPYLPLANISPNPDVRNLVPENILRKYSAIPLDRYGPILTVVMSDPSDEAGIQEIESVSQCKVQVFITTFSELENAMGHFYDDSQPRKI